MSSGQDKRRAPPVEADSDDSFRTDQNVSDTAETKRRTARRGTPKAVHGGNDDMGAALRSAYQLTVNETVPDEMLDLLGKLD